MLSLLKYGKPLFGIRNRIRIRTFLGLPAPDPDPSVRGTNPDPAPDTSLFLINVLSGLQNKILAKNKFFRHEDDVPVGKLRKKYEEKIILGHP
jgi:hypothetical protein